MALTGVYTQVKDGGLTLPLSADGGSCGLIITGVGNSKITINGDGYSEKVFELTTLNDVETRMGIKSNDTTINVNIYKKAKEYFDQLPRTSLFVQVVNDTITTAKMVDRNEKIIKNLFDNSKNLQIVGVVRLPKLTNDKIVTTKTTDALALADVIKDGIAKEVIDAIPLAQATGDHYADTLDMPLIFVIGGHFYNGNPDDLKDFNVAGNKTGRVSVVLSTLELPQQKFITKNNSSTDANNTAHKVNYGVAIVGSVLGRISNVDASTNIGRTADGALKGLDTTYLGLKTSVSSPSDYAMLHAKRYLFVRHYNRKNGGFFADDTSLGGEDSDFKTISTQRVIDLARMISYNVYINEINEKLGFINNKITPDSLAYYNAVLGNALTEGLIDAGQAVSFNVLIDPNQDVLTTRTLQVSLSIVPYANVGTIIVTLNYSRN